MMKKMKMTPRIIRNIVPNPACLTFDVNIPISDSYIKSFHLPLRKSSEEYLEEVGLVGAVLVRKISSVLGVEQVSLQQYSVQVMVGKAFRPDEDGITDHVTDALKDCFGDQRDKVEVEIRDDRHFYGDGGRSSDLSEI